MQIDDYQRYLQMMNQWLILKQEGKSLEKYFIERGYGTIGVYGIGIYGRHLIRELSDGSVKILYGIDQKEMKPYKGIKIVHLDEHLSKVDVIVNTVIQDHEKIKMQLSSIFSSPIICLEDVVFESYE